jgi:dihydrofolate reductase
LENLPELDGRVFIIGGAEIYAVFMGRLDDLLVSHVSGDYPGDTWFPEFEDEFNLTEVLETHATFEVRRHFRSEMG